MTGDVTGNLTGNATGDITGDVKTTAADGTASTVLNSNVGDDAAVFRKCDGNDGNVTGDVAGNLTGNATGDITGDVKTTAADGTIYSFKLNVGSDDAAVFTGNVTGNVTGDVTGNLLVMQQVILWVMLRRQLPMAALQF